MRSLSSSEGIPRVPGGRRAPQRPGDTPQTRVQTSHLVALRAVGPCSGHMRALGSVHCQEALPEGAACRGGPGHHGEGPSRPLQCCVASVIPPGLASASVPRLSPPWMESEAPCGLCACHWQRTIHSPPHPGLVSQILLAAGGQALHLTSRQ